MCFRWVHLPTKPFFPQARLTGIFGLEPPLRHFDLSCTWACLPVVLPLSLVPKQGEGFFLSPLISLALQVFSVRTPPAAILASGGVSPVLQLMVLW